MKQIKNNKIVIILLVVTIIVLTILCVLLATETINLKNNSINQNNDILNVDNNQSNKSTRIFIFGDSDSYIETKDTRDNSVYKIYLSKDGEVYIELNGNKKKLAINEKVLYVELIQNAMDGYYSLVMLAKDHKAYEYIMSNYKNNIMDAKLLRNDVTKLFTVNVPGEYEFASSGVTTLLAKTTNNEYVEINLTRSY